MLEKMLQAVLNKAHDGHTYVTDKEQYGLEEYWTNSLVGDCEDFSIAVRELLKEINIESDLIYCKDENGEGHLVCSVDGWILDNRHKWLQRRDDLPYTWLRLGKPDGTWYEISL